MGRFNVWQLVSSPILSEAAAPEEIRMTLGPRMLELQQAMSAYGETSVRHYKTLVEFGDSVIARFYAFLGEGSQVRGVPPEGDWSPDAGDYHHAKFSTHRRGLIVIEPILMGVGIRIPHAGDDDALWLRVVVEMEIRGDTIAVQVHDGSSIGGIGFDYDYEDVERVQEAIFECARDALVNPVRSARGSLRIGFVDERT
jgi:hypothetical protein